jgi:SAM-dependent methyltransferase
MEIKKLIKGFPVVGRIATTLSRKLNPPKSQQSEIPFRSSADYWETRYALGGNSGVGSYSKFAEFKAQVLNEFVRVHSVQSVVEFGCGDGNQLRLAQYPSYRGYDISPSAVDLCRKSFAADSTKAFDLVGSYNNETFDLALSLDVIFHLVEDAVFEDYMRTLFGAATRYVVIYSSDTEDDEDSPHVRHRAFSKWVERNIARWRLIRQIPNRYPYRGDWRKGSFADFFVYQADQ